MTSKIARFFSFARIVPLVFLVESSKREIIKWIYIYVCIYIYILDSLNITNIARIAWSRCITAWSRIYTIQLTLVFFFRHLSQILLQEGGLGSCEPIIGHGRKGKLPNRLPGSASRGGSQNGREYPLPLTNHHPQRIKIS